MDRTTRYRDHPALLYDRSSEQYHGSGRAVESCPSVPTISRVVGSPCPQIETERICEVRLLVVREEIVRQK